LDAGKKVDIVIEFVDNYSNLEDVGDGKYDSFLYKASDTPVAAAPFCCRMSPRVPCHTYRTVGCCGT
jgi:hypothetical protein